eukprot:XP_001692944.1 predicted protein [Chlamydomonas reinhardtii]
MDVGASSNIGAGTAGQGDARRSQGDVGPARNTGVSRFVPRRAVSPGTTRISATSIANTLQPATGPRPRDKFVPLPDANRKPQVVTEERDEDLARGDSESELPLIVQKRGRITVVTYVRTAYGEAAEAPGEVFFFDYGVVALWGMTEAQEQALLGRVLGCRGVAVELLDEDEKQVEELLFVYSRDAKPHISNDTFTIDIRQAADHKVKMAISHALAQSSKLAVYERRMVGLVEEVRHIPGEMAATGAISMSRRNVAKVMGKVRRRRREEGGGRLIAGKYDYMGHDSHATLGTLVGIGHVREHNLARLDVIIVVLILIEVVMAAIEVVGFVLRRKGWVWHGPKLWELIWGRRHHPHHMPPAPYGPTVNPGDKWAWLGPLGTSTSLPRPSTVPDAGAVGAWLWASAVRTAGLQGPRPAPSHSCNSRPGKFISKVPTQARVSDRAFQQPFIPGHWSTRDRVRAAPPAVTLLEEVSAPRSSSPEQCRGPACDTRPAPQAPHADTPAPRHWPQSRFSPR